MASSVRAKASRVVSPVPDSDVSGLIPNSDAPAMSPTTATTTTASTMNANDMTTLAVTRRLRETGRASR